MLRSHWLGAALELSVTIGKSLPALPLILRTAEGSCFQRGASHFAFATIHPGGYISESLIISSKLPPGLFGQWVIGNSADTLQLPCALYGCLYFLFTSLLVYFASSARHSLKIWCAVHLLKPCADRHYKCALQTYCCFFGCIIAVISMINNAKHVAFYNTPFVVVFKWFHYNASGADSVRRAIWKQIFDFLLPDLLMLPLAFTNLPLFSYNNYYFPKNQPESSAFQIKTSIVTGALQILHMRHFFLDLNL